MELKFKVWDIEEQKMFEVDILNIGFGASSYSYPQGAEKLVSVGTLDSNRIIMQNTGVKDKNEKEIYFGDIVEIVTEYIISRGNKYVIEFDKKEMCIKPFTDNIWETIRPEDCVVIGNIFQNPELLNKAL